MVDTSEPTVSQYLTGAADLRQVAGAAAQLGNPDARAALNLANVLDHAAEARVFGEAQ